MRGFFFRAAPKKEVTQGPKPLGAQLPYESDSFEPGNQFYVRSRRRVNVTPLPRPASSFF